MTTKRNGFDLRGIDLAPVAFFTLKRDAVAFAKSCGWSARDVSFAWNRFNAFFIVCQVVGEDIRLVRKDRSTLDLPNPGRS